MWDRHFNNIKSSLNSSSEFSGLLLLNQKSEGSLLFRGTVILLVYIRVSSLFSLISIYITLDVHLSFNLSIFVKFYIQENTWILKATMTINIKSMTSKLVNYAVLKWKSVYNEEYSFFFLIDCTASLHDAVVQHLWDHLSNSECLWHAVLLAYPIWTVFVRSRSGKCLCSSLCWYGWCQ